LTSTSFGDGGQELGGRIAGEHPASSAPTFVALILVSLVTVFPLVWMVSSAFKTGTEVYSLAVVPETPTLENFEYVFTQVPFARYMFNSFLVSATVTIVALLFHSMAAYALARLRFPGREFVFSLIFATLLVSLPVILVPLFVLVRAMGLLDSYAGLIVPAIFNAFGIFLLRQFYLGIPASWRRRRSSTAPATGGSTRTSSCRSRGRSWRRSRSSSSWPTGTRSSGR
jgi:ABC-type glycerol-3-phosphate transport system permease component